MYYKRVQHSASMHISSEIKQNARLKFHIHINTAHSDWWLTTTKAKKIEYCMYDVVLLVGKMIIPVIGPKPKQMYFLVWHTTIFFSLSLDSICVCHVNRMLLFICMYTKSTLCYCFHLNQAENYNVLTWVALVTHTMFLITSVTLYVINSSLTNKYNYKIELFSVYALSGCLFLLFKFFKFIPCLSTTTRTELLHLIFDLIIYLTNNFAVHCY